MRWAVFVTNLFAVCFCHELVKLDDIRVRYSKYKKGDVFSETQCTKCVLFMILRLGRSYKEMFAVQSWLVGCRELYATSSLYSSAFSTSARTCTCAGSQNRYETAHLYRPWEKWNKKQWCKQDFFQDQERHFSCSIECFNVTFYMMYSCKESTYAVENLYR